MIIFEGLTSNEIDILVKKFVNHNITIKSHENNTFSFYATVKTNIKHKGKNK